MKTTTDRATVGGVMLARALNQIMLESRDILPKERNGRPRAPSDSRAAQIRKDIGQGRANPFGMLLTVLECDVRDQVPFAEIVAPLRQMIAHLEEIAVCGALRVERPIMALMRTETRAQARTDLAQLKLAESPESLDALAEVIREAEGHKLALGELVDAGVRQLAVVRNQPRATIGARRLAVV